MAEITLDFTPRPQQEEILSFVQASIRDGKKYVMVDAPTGTGKSYAAIMIADWYRREINPNARVDILTNTKILQDQYTKDFAFAANLKGKNNYWCRKSAASCGEAMIVNKATNKKCEYCPYQVARSEFLRSPLSLTNFHLITSYAMYSPDMLDDRDSRLLIIDEAHAFEEIFCDFISSVFSEASLTQLEIWQPWMDKDLSEISDIGELADYVNRVIIPKMEAKIADLIDEAKESRSKRTRSDLAKKADHVDKTMCKYNRFVRDRENFSTNWIFEKTLDYKGNLRILVEPIWANIYLKEMFWDKYDHIIFMSGTLLNKDLMSFILGIEPENTTYLDLPCPFDPKKRPVLYVKFGKMSYYQKKETFSKAVPVIKRILDKNRDNKGIIHTANYELSRWIESSIQDKRFIFHTTYTREAALQNHLASEFDTVIVSPSMINGIDLKDELSRFQIILKIPFPNLMSTKIKRRLDTKPEWYNWKTLVDLLQSYGRSIRNEEDWAETYILDECFDQVLDNQKVPKYFLDATSVINLHKN